MNQNTILTSMLCVNGYADVLLMKPQSKYSWWGDKAFRDSTIDDYDV